jgi:uncharacterized protein (TIGR02145 family)
LDIDGNQYRTVKIGNQWWMAENLKVTRFRNGQSIYEAVTTEDWIAVPSAYCLYGGSAQAPGFLYNWGAVSDTAGLAPEGWRIPTDDDWKQLERVIGMTAGESDRTGWRGSDEGEKLKMEALTGWAFFDNVWATNESGFSAEAGSCRLFDGTFGNPGLKYNGFWWTISENGTDEAWFRNLDYKKRGVFRYYGLKKYGFSVRCVKIQ